MDSSIEVHARPASASTPVHQRTVPVPATAAKTAELAALAASSPVAAKATNEFLTRQDLRWGQSVSEPVFARFFEWTEEYRTAGAPQKAALEAEGVTIARERRETMRSLIQTNPERALELTVPIGVRQSLPETVAALLEERISGRGSLNVFAALAEPGQESKVTPTFRTAVVRGREYRAFVYGRRLGEPTRFDIPLNGVAVDDAFAVNESPLRLLEPEETSNSTAAKAEPICAVSGNASSINKTPVAADLGGAFKFFCAPAHAAQMNEQLIQAEVAGDVGGGGEVQANVRTEGTKKLLFIRVDFSDLPGAPFPDLTGVNLISGLNDFFMEQSYGRSGFFLNAAGSEITPTLRMPQTASYYGGNNAYYQLRSDARAAAAAAGYVLSNYDYDLYCFGAVPGWYWAGLGYVGASGVWLRSYFTVGVAGHELGHNYGLNHANFWDTGDQGTANDDASVEYGDMFDTMGSANGGSYHFNARYKSYMNWLTSSETHTVSSSGTYRIFPHDDPAATSLRGLRIVRSSTTNYWVEFRQRFTANKWLMNGAGIRWAGNGNERSHLLDTTPGSPDGKIDSALVIGRTFSDHTAGVHITALRKGGTIPESLDVVVNLGTFPGNAAPSVVVNAETTSVSPGATVTFSTVSADNNGDTLAYYWDFGDGTFGTNGALAGKIWPVAGEYLVRCVVSDMKGGVGSDSVLVTVGSPTTYRISGQVTASGAPLEGVRVAVSSVKVTYTDSDGTYTLAGLPAGSYTVTATLNGTSFSPSGFANPISVGPNASLVNFGSTGGGGVTNPASITLTSPADNATYTAPASVFLAANATPAAGGNISKVEFYQGATKLGEDGAFPYSFTWNGASVGNYSLTARAFQGSSAVATSAPVAISITPIAPGITSQPQSQTVAAGGTATFAVTASGTAPLGYRWRFNGSEIAGAGNASLSLFNVQIPQAGAYSVVVTNAAGAVTSSIAALTVTCSYNLSANSRSFGASGGAGSVGVTSQGSCSWSVANVPSWITVTSGNGGSGNGTVNYSVATNATGASRIATLLIGGRSYNVTQAAPDLIPPTVAFASPAANASFTNAQIIVAGSADDNDAVWRVEVSVGSGAFAPATGADPWSASVFLAPGTNVIRVRSFDISGNVSATNTRSVFCAVPGTLSLVVNGMGLVKGATNGQSLHIGRLCKLTAAPMPGFVFSNWTGDVSSDSPTLSFLMQSNLAVTANFVTNPFVPVKGVFNGLFHESNQVRVASSGSFSVKLTDKGTYSVSLRLGGAKLSASGQFDLEGRATASVRRAGTGVVTLALAVAMNGSDRITGTLSDGNWTAHLLGDRAPGSAASLSAPPGKYTLILLGSPGTTLAPGGDSYGTVSIDAKGNISVKGSLADKTVISAKVSLSRDGYWPLHVPLYAGKGALLGWVNFTDGPATDFDGVMSWIKPAIPTAAFYPNGFTSEAALLGSRYTRPIGATDRVLELTNTAVMLAGGNLSQSFTNDVVLGSGSKVINAGPYPLALKFTASSGMYKGTCLPPGANKPVAFKGVVLQKGNYGSGYFLGTDLSGWAGFGHGSLSPANPFEPASVR